MTREWRDDALCRDLAPAFDYTVEGESAKQRTTRLADAVATCAQCPVAVECRAAVDPLLDFDVRPGVVLGVDVPKEKRPKGKQPLTREHGSQRGWRQHIDRGDMPPCQPCRTANRAYESRRRRGAAA